MKIVALDSENVKRLRAVHIEPDGSLVIIGGRNEQGKTSVLDSIAYALGGEKLIPAKPLRKGEKKGRIQVTLDGGLVVTRTFTAEGGGSLRVENEDGAIFRSPQRMLNDLVGQLSFDPLAFAEAKPREQVEMLRAVVGLDFADHDRRRQGLYDRRTEVNREVKRLEGAIASIPAHEDAPEEEVSAAALADELQAAEATEQALADAEDQVEIGRGMVEETEAEIEALEAKLKSARGLRTERQRALRLAEQERDRAAAARVDPEPVRARLRAVDEQNRKWRETQDRKARQEELAERRKESDGLTEKIRELDQAKEAALAEAPFPVEGLGFSEDGVTFKGVPFEQSSGAERIQVSVAMGLALNPKCRVLLIRDGSLLDEDHLRLVTELAEKHDAQVWIERVGDRDEAAIVIEDGQVAGAEATEASRA